MNLIVGASGTVGRRVARRLLERGEAVRVVSRDPSRVAELVALGAMAAQGDLRADDWMPPALDGVRTVVLSSHGLVPPTRDNHPGITDGAGNRRIIDAARRAGVGQIVFVSATSGADAPALFARVKYQTEEYLKASGIAYTILRPTVFIETHAILLLAEPLRRSGSVQLFGPGTTTLNWISADDVAERIDLAVHDETLRGRTETIGGPDRLSRLDVLQIIEQTLGRTARRRHVPLPMLRVMRFLCASFHPGLHYLIDMAVAEATSAESAMWAPRTLDWIGPTSVRTVTQRWAGTGSPDSPTLSGVP